MDLYDDLDTKQRPGQVDGWSSGIKMLQTQLAIKKATLPQPRKEPPKKPMLTPVASLRSKKQPDEDIFQPKVENRKQQTISHQALPPIRDNSATDFDWESIDEYDPMWPNEYEKLVKEKRDKDKKKPDEHRGGGAGGNSDRKRRNENRGGGGGKSEGGGPSMKFSGMGTRISEEDSYARSPPSRDLKGSGAAIAPPPSLQENSGGNTAVSENSSIVTIPYGASSVAAKIMAKYGFKDGQGLGKQEQGMSIALQVEKTSKRGGRIIHEKELLMPPPPLVASPPPPMAPGPVGVPQTGDMKSEPTITEIMKAPSKVVLLRNMVGPGDVDSELEPEVKEECQTKYGDVISCVIHELFGVCAEEAVRIFVEFKRIESAIKAVVDLNGRFFGGRQVRAGFYDFDKYKTLQLNE